MSGWFTHLKRAVTEDRGEDGSGQHGDDGQDHRHAVCGGSDKKLLLHGDIIRMTNKDTEVLKKKENLTRTNS